MGVEIIEDDNDLLRLGEVLIDQLAHGVRPVDGGALRADAHAAAAEMGRHPRDQAASLRSRGGVGAPAAPDWWRK